MVYSVDVHVRVTPAIRDGLRSIAKATGETIGGAHRRILALAVQNAGSTCATLREEDDRESLRHRVALLESELAAAKASLSKALPKAQVAERVAAVMSGILREKEA